MANAADYLIITQDSQPFTQVLSSYKLRSRSTSVVTFVATNAALGYTLSTIVEPNLDGVFVTPSNFTLLPNESTTITVSFDTAILETLSAGTLTGALDFTVSAAPIVIPEIPQPPAAASLPEAPKQIISRIEIVPSVFTFSVLGETKQLQAILYVDDVPVTDNVSFSWEMDENLGNAFEASPTGIITSLRPGVFTGVAKAKLVSPSQYVGTVGLSRVNANIPVIVTTDPTAPPPPTTANIAVQIEGLPNNIPANVTITGITSPVTENTTLTDLLPGNYTITPNVITVGGQSYIPTGGGPINIQAGETVLVGVKYKIQAPVDVNTIQIIAVRGAKGDLLQGTRAFVGERITITAQTYKNGEAANIGPIQFNVSGTSVGTQTIETINSSGRAEAVFEITQDGPIEISVSSAGKVATGNIAAINRGRYTIRINAPQQIYAGQCTAITATVYDGNTPLSNIPVNITVSGGLLSDTPCGLEPIAAPQPVFIPEPTATGTSAATGTSVGMDFTQPIVDRATTTSRTLNEAELRTGGNTARDTVVFVDQGENAI